MDQTKGLEEQSDQVLHCLPFHLHLLDSLHYKATMFKFRVITANVSGVRNFMIFTVSSTLSL